MFGSRLIHRFLVASILLSGACVPKLLPETNRLTFRIDVTNPFADPMNVTVNHIDGIAILGVVPPHKSRQYQIRMWQAQRVFVIATKKDGVQVLRQVVYLDPGCVAQVVLRDVRVAQRLAGPLDPVGDDAQPRGDSPVAAGQGRPGCTVL